MRALRFPLFAALTAAGALLLLTSRYDAPAETRTFLDRNGRVIGTLNASYDGLQDWTPLERIPREAVERTIRAEDRWFYWHRGINPFSIASAIADNLAHGRIVRGGSTITQQLAKNLMGSPPRTFFNKLRETLLALGLEMRHGKAWILERYLNTVYYGRRCYGIAAAARSYFGKELAGLSSQEIAFLVERPKAPNRNVGANLVFTPTPSMHGRHFLEYVAHDRPNAANVVRTTLDLDLQQRLEQATARLLAGRAFQDPKLTAAAVVIDVTTGDLLAMVGSRDYLDETIDGQVNAAVALRQPGSTLKPFTYFAAFAKGFGPDSIVPDQPLSFQAAGVEQSESYAPQNFDRRFHGNMTIREALANSYNVPAVVTLNQIGLSYYHEILRRFGFTTLKRPPMHYGLAVTLGSGEVTLLELTNAYAALARGGRYLAYRAIPMGATPHNGAASADTRFAPSSVLPNASEYAAEVTSILTDPDARLKSFGFNESMTIEGHEVAVKTGTSYDYRDNWTVGYTPSYAAGVWVGHADGSPMPAPIGSSPTAGPTTGATGAAPLWHAAMENVLRGKAPETFAVARNNPRKGMARHAPTITEPSKPWRVVSPLPNATFRLHAYLPAVHQKIAAEAGAAPDQNLRWFLDGRFLAASQGDSKVWIVPEPGKHTLKVTSQDGYEEEVAFKIVSEDNI
ncbi:MAG TPA: transglycosylase domain-containing protein [bacterium]|nr:transglycosylase domain-containing protein [bacterium]